MKKEISLTVIVPFYNEEDYLKDSILRLIKEESFSSLIMVNDASTDNSLSIANSLLRIDNRIKLISLEHNNGKGNAIKEGLKLVDTSHVIVHDADLEYFPKDITTMFNLLLKNQENLIIGSRTLNKQNVQNRYLITYLGNKYLTKLFCLVNNCNVSDIASCYWLISTEILKSMQISEKGFGIEVEVFSKYISSHGDIIETPIDYSGRTYLEGKKIKLSDGLNIFIKIIKFSKLFNRRNY